MTIPLAKVADLTQVERVCDLIEGRACVVVGSAPLPTQYAEVSDSEVVIAVNGSISSVARAVDLWVVASRPQDRPGSPLVKPLHKLMLQQSKGRAAGHVLFLRGPKDTSEKETLKALQQLGFSLNTWSVLDKPVKRHIEGELCGRVDDKQPCSSGILAVAITLYCGAASVRMVGFSLTPGYNYIRDPKMPPQRWWRNHCAADERALRELHARYGSKLSGSLLEQVVAL